MNNNDISSTFSSSQKSKKIFKKDKVQTFKRKARVLKEEQKGDESCTICLTEIDNYVIARPDSCKHSFHFDCLEKWSTEGENSCPMCKLKYKSIVRKDITLNQKQVLVNDKSQASPDQA